MVEDNADEQNQHSKSDEYGSFINGSITNSSTAISQWFSRSDRYKLLKIRQYAAYIFKEKSTQTLVLLRMPGRQNNDRETRGLWDTK